MQQVQQKLHRDLPLTTVWAYGAAFPGPVIEAGVGQPVTVKWINDLRDGNGQLRTNHYLAVDTCLHGPDMAGATPRTVVHLHGGKVDAEGRRLSGRHFPARPVAHELLRQRPAGRLRFGSTTTRSASRG